MCAELVDQDGCDELAELPGRCDERVDADADADVDADGAPTTSSRTRTVRAGDEVLGLAVELR